MFRRYVEALANRDYFTLWTASLTAGAASWALIVARGWLVFDISHSSFWVGIVTFSAMTPRLAITPFSGYLSDRFDRRRVLAVMFAVNIGSSLALGVLVMNGTIETWHLVLLSLINGSAHAAQMQVTQTLIPNMVPKGQILNAISLHQATVHGSRLLGPASIAPLMLVADVEAAFFLCTAFYVVSLVQTLRVRTSSTGVIDSSRGFMSNMADGLAYVYRERTLRAVVIISIFHCGMTMSIESLLPVLSQERLNAQGHATNYLMMAIGAGALVASLAMAGVHSEATKGKLLLNMGVLSGLSYALLGLATNVPLAVFSAVFMGATQAAFMTIAHAMVQVLTPDGVRGRVAGVYSVHVGGMMALSNLANGLLADHISVQTLLVVGGVGFIVVMFVSWYWATLRQIYTAGLKVEPRLATE
ncbi:MAG: MFS transporter [SAR202 cluster bacterium]|nr:MFS transporter [SAR202 cluster bacterium]